MPISSIPSSSKNTLTEIPMPMSLGVQQPQQPKLMVGSHLSSASGFDAQSFYTAHDGAKSGVTSISRRKSETEYMSVLDSNTPY